MTSLRKLLKDLPKNINICDNVTYTNYDLQVLNIGKILLNSSDNIINSKCSAVISSSISCIPFIILVELAKAAKNIYIMKNISDDRVDEYKAYLMKELRNEYKDENEENWLKNTIINNMNREYRHIFQKYVFLTRGVDPNDKKWLSNINIDDVLTILASSYTNLHCFNTTVSDFMKYDDMKITTNQMNKLIDIGKNTFILIFNTCTRSTSGEHWIEIYTNINTGNIYYIDSGGKGIRRNIKEYINFMKSFCKEKPIIRIGTTEHQTENTECGVYSLFFATCHVKGIPFEKLNKKRIKDSTIHKYRTQIYSRL